MNWIDETLSRFLRWCEHPLFDFLLRYAWIRARAMILIAKMRALSGLLTVTGFVGSPWMMRACKCYHIRLEQEAACLTVEMHAARPDPAALAKWRDAGR